jgi:multiple sugar transport system substrate-binding protein
MRRASGSRLEGNKKHHREDDMQDFTRRALLQGGTALAAGAALTGPALLEFAKAWAQTAQWKPEAGAKLTLMRWKRFVPAEDDAFNAIVAAFKSATGVEMNVFSESFEDVQPKASVAANTGSGLDMVWGLHTLPQLFPTKVVKMNDVADYLGKKYGGWTDAAAKTCMKGGDWLGIPVATVGGYMTYRKSAVEKAGFKEFPKDFPGFLEMCKGLKKNNTPAGFALGHATGDANAWVHWVLWGHGAYTVDKSDKVIINSPETMRRSITPRRWQTASSPARHRGTTARTTRPSWQASSTAPPTASRSMWPRKTIRR